jgi:radical SAM protein with 4Fe4S-binding SPASM domain
MGMALREPHLLPTMAWFGLRTKFGLSYDRKHGNGRCAMPVEVKIHLTRRCNLHCIMCNQHRHTEGTADLLPWCDPKRELPVEAWIDLLDQLVSWSSFGRRQWIDVTGGEPTLYADMPRFLEEAKKRHFFINLLTNATTLDRLADFLVRLGVHVVNVSLDGPGELHDQIRGQKGQYERVVRGLKALTDARRRHGGPGPILALSTTISRANMDRLEEMIPLAEELGADSLLYQHTSFDWADNVAAHNRVLSPEFCQAEGLNVLHPSIPEGGWYDSEITEDDLPILAKSTARIQELAKKSRLRIAFDPLTMRLELLKPYYFDRDFPFPQVCDHIYKAIRVHPDGTVMPCLGFMAGNIRDTPIREIWEGPAMNRFRQMFTDKILPGCARCCQRRYTGSYKIGVAHTTD